MLEVHNVQGKGRGVFATRTIAKGEFVCEYTGELLTEAESNVRALEYDFTDNDCEKGCYMFWFKHGKEWFCLDASKDDGSFGRLINHSKRKPNLRPRVCAHSPKLFFYACRPISAGDELAYDYGENNPKILAMFPWLKY